MAFVASGATRGLRDRVTERPQVRSPIAGAGLDIGWKAEARVSPQVSGLSAAWTGATKAIITNERTTAAKRDFLWADSVARYSACLNGQLLTQRTKLIVHIV
jgi:hypothetical protein